jgi:hypothetical protein
VSFIRLQEDQAKSKQRDKEEDAYSSSTVVAFSFPATGSQNLHSTSTPTPLCPRSAWISPRRTSSIVWPAIRLTSRRLCLFVLDRTVAVLASGWALRTYGTMTARDVKRDLTALVSKVVGRKNDCIRLTIEQINRPGCRRDHHRRSSGPFAMLSDARPSMRREATSRQCRIIRFPRSRICMLSQKLKVLGVLL